MKILSAKQIRTLDAYTIENEPIASLDLMERASMTFVNWFEKNFPTGDFNIYIFCGSGNNGGDGLAIARLLYHRSYNIILHSCEIGSKKSVDYVKNLTRLPKHALDVKPIFKGDPFLQINKDDLVIDAIFGSGLNRPVEGYWSKLILYLSLIHI